MRNYNPINGLLIDYSVQSPKGKTIKNKKSKDVEIGDFKFTITNFDNLKSKPSMGTRGIGEPTTIAKAVLSNGSEGINPWDLAHETRKLSKDLKINFTEPDIIHINNTYNQKNLNREIIRSFGRDEKIIGDYDSEWSHPMNKKEIWHLGDDYSQLKASRDAVNEIGNKVRIAHFDTGILKGHPMLPDNIIEKLQRSFSHDDDISDDASDRRNNIFNGIGHGTSTLSILAGRKSEYEEYGFNDYLGGAPHAEIIPVRISRSVVLLATSAFVEAIDYILGLNATNQCDIITMSMGGLPTKAWANAVNRAYEKGIFISCASGDNVGGLPTANTIYPARFRRVVNVTGVCYDYTPYYHGNIFNTKAVQGNFGPEFLMDNAIAAFSPNVPWIAHDKDDNILTNKIGLDGAGTSSSTPQVAAAAANYIRKYRKELDTLLPWQKVEAIRNALFQSAYKRNVNGDNMKLYFGNGILKANDALSIGVNDYPLIKQPEDEVRFPLFKMLFGRSFSASPDTEIFNQMIEVELLQIIESSASLQKMMNKVNYDFISLNVADKNNFIEEILEQSSASNTLKKYLEANRQLIFK